MTLRPRGSPTCYGMKAESTMAVKTEIQALKKAKLLLQTMLSHDACSGNGISLLMTRDMVSMQRAAGFTEGMGSTVPLEGALAGHLTHPVALRWPNS